MSGDANEARIDDWNLTAGFDLERVGELENVTDELYPLPDYVNVTSLSDVNTTEQIDSFYFYEVSRASAFSILFFAFCVTKLRETVRIARGMQFLEQLLFSNPLRKKICDRHLDKYCYRISKYLCLKYIFKNI